MFVGGCLYVKISQLNNIIQKLQTNILNDQLNYKTHTLFDTLSHTPAILTNISAFPTSMNGKVYNTTVLPGPPSLDNSAHGIGKLLLKTQVREDIVQ
jgi:hypothetical protein